MDIEIDVNKLVEEFVCKRGGGVVLAANKGETIAAFRGDLPVIFECLMRPLTQVLLTFARQNPEDFRLAVGAITTHMVAVAKVASYKYDLPHLSEETMDCLENALENEELATETFKLVKSFIKEAEAAAEEAEQ